VRTERLRKSALDYHGNRPFGMALSHPCWLLADLTANVLFAVRVLQLLWYVARQASFRCAGANLDTTAGRHDHEHDAAFYASRINGLDMRRTCVHAATLDAVCYKMLWM
jgi:hypothetical protein